MTDRIRHITVILDRDIRDDDVQGILEAIRHIRYVARVEPHVITAPDQLARAVAKVELHEKVLEAIGDVFADRSGRPGS